MDSTGNMCHVNEQEQAEEKIIDNAQLTGGEPGQKDEMDENGPKSLIMEIYPWISQFKKMCRNSLDQRSISSLKNLMTFFIRNARPSVTECHTKPLRAERLKDSIGETLLFFLYYYRDVGELKDRDCYLIGMSDLLALYIDMELKASKKGKEHSSKISARLSSCLHVYLERSTEYLLDTLLKVHFMNHNYQEILDPVITKVFKTIDDHPDSSIMYVRYFLAYRLWKKLNKDVAVRNQINMIALTSLGVAPSDFPTIIPESVLPQVPKNQKISTKLLLLQKFEIEKACEEFFNFCNKRRGLKSNDVDDDDDDDASLADAIVSVPEESNDRRDLIRNNDNFSNVTNNVDSSIKQSCLVNSLNKSSVRKSSIGTGVSCLRKSKKINDIVFIDLTSDVVTEKVIRKKKTRRKLRWLESAKSRISSKIVMKKNSSTEDSSRRLEESSLKIGSLKISEQISAKIDQVEENIMEERRRNVDEDASPTVRSIENTDEKACWTVTNSLVNKTSRSLECSKPESRKNEKNRVQVDNIGKEKERGDISEEVVSSSPVPEVSFNQMEASSLETEARPADQYSHGIKLDDTAELASSNDEKTRYIHRSKVCASEQRASKDKTLVEIRNVPSQPAVKPEQQQQQQQQQQRLDVSADEIINEPVVSSEMKVQVAEYASEISLVCDEPTEGEMKKIRETEFQDNIDGLSLLASVSQRISHLATTPNPVNRPEVIKVKNYASLANLSANEEPESSSETVKFLTNKPESPISEKIIDIYPESAMDKVAYQVEITSTEETDSYPLRYDIEETRCNSHSQAIVDSTNLVEKDETTNVILNGETVVLFQKSPNSNLYIINKAVENRDHANDEAAAAAAAAASLLHREMNDRANDSTGFSYEIYDSIYRSQVASYEIKQYKREVSSQQETRRNKIKPEAENKNCGGGDPLEPAKSIKKLDPIDEKTRIKRKLSDSNISRRRRIKQEFEDCGGGGNISNRIKTNYGMQSDRPPEHPDQKHTIHIPVAHSTPMYTKYSSAAAELYLPCHKNCNSIACSLSVDPPTSLHAHSANNTSGGTPRCSCLNCAYDIMTRCTECIIPNGDARTTGIDPNSYYVPLHSGQNSNVPECNGTSINRDTLAKIYDDQLICNFEQKILDAKPLENSKYETKDNYRAELDNKLPLKKRFKAIMAMSFVEDQQPLIKLEKLQSYPGTPMLSIAALEANKNCLDDKLSKKFGNPTSPVCPNSQSRESIRRDCPKEMMLVSPPPPLSGSMQNSHRSGAKRKRSRNTISDDAEYEKKIIKSPAAAGSCKRSPTKSLSRIIDKSDRETETATPKKISSTRQTRSSKRNVPKVNYIYTDAGDSDWNPSGAGLTENSLNKRKRKRTSR